MSNDNVSSATDQRIKDADSTAGERSALWMAVNALGSPDSAETTPEGHAYNRAIDDVLAVIERHESQTAR